VRLLTPGSRVTVVNPRVLALLAVAIENRLGARRKWRLYDMADLRKLHGCIISLRVGRQLTPDLDACPI
jgi:hypothetical protein